MSALCFVLLVVVSVKQNLGFLVTLTHCQENRLISTACSETESLGPSPLKISKFLGSIDTQHRVRENERLNTHIRLFEGDLNGVKCLVKEFMAGALSLGKTECRVVRTMGSKKSEETLSVDQPSPVPLLLGTLRPGAIIHTEDFRQDWRQRFLRLLYPTEENLWLVYVWNELTLRPLKRFPVVPQVVEGLDYFRKDKRDAKRWRFVRRIIRCTIQAVDYLHRHGYSHGAINSASIWLNTYNQLGFERLAVTINDFGACQKLSELNDEDARTVTLEDWYQLGFVFLELILSSFAEDDSGAQIVRARYGLPIQRASSSGSGGGHFTHFELQKLFTSACDGDFQSLRQAISSVGSWSTAVSLLEAQEEQAWQLVFTLLAHGQLYDPEKQRPVKVTGRRLLRQHEAFFEDTY